MAIESVLKQTYTNLQVIVQDNNSADELHLITDQVERNLEDKLHSDVVTHIDPISISGCVENKINKMVKPILDKYLLDSIQDLRVKETDGILKEINFEIPCSVEFKNEHEVNSELIRIICGKYPESNLEIDFRKQI